MQNDLRFPSAKNFFTTLGWLSVIALLAVVVVFIIVLLKVGQISV